MKDNRAVRVWSVVALGVAAVGPLAAACAGNDSQQTAAAPANPAMAPQAGATYPAAAAPPGYPGAAPPGYPAQPGAGAQPAYPAQPGYTAQNGYPPATAQPQPYPPQQPYPPAATPYPPAPGAPVATAPAPAPTAAPAGTLAPTDPNSIQSILQGIQNAIQGTVVPGGAVPGDLTEAGLKAYALHAAPGMQPEGDELKQTMTEGQHAVMMVTLQAGKCYTLIGFSVPGAVKDLDLNLLAPPLYLTLAGQDLTHNNTPAIGASPSPMCPIIAFPLQYKLDVFAKSGSGQVAVQLYSKNKS